MEETCRSLSPLHPQEAKTLAAGKIIPKKLPKTLEKAAVLEQETQPEPEPKLEEPQPQLEQEPVKEEKLSPEPILVNVFFWFLLGNEIYLNKLVMLEEL